MVYSVSLNTNIASVTEMVRNAFSCTGEIWLRSWRVSWVVYSMSPSWLPVNIFSKHRQYIRLFCHFFAAISHQYRPIPTFFLGRPAAAQSVREPSQEPSPSLLHLSPPLLLHPHPTALLSGQPSSLSAIRFFLPGISFLQLLQAGEGGSRLTTPPDFPPNSGALRKKLPTRPTFPDILIAAATEREPLGGVSA